MTTSVEVRCPVGPRRLFLKLQLEGVPTPVVDGNLIELACADCRKALEREEGTRVKQVLHYYNIAGEWISTTVVR